MLQSNPRGHRNASHSYEVPLHLRIMMVVIHVIMVQYIMIVRSDYKNWCISCRDLLSIVTSFVSKCTSRMQPVIDGDCKITDTNESRED